MFDLFDKSERYYIGVDPGETTGVAIMDTKTAKFKELSGLAFWDFIILVNKILNNRGDVRDINNKIVGIYFCVEDPNQNKPVFPMADETKAFSQALETNNEELHKSTLRVFSRRAQNVGMNKQIAKFVIEYLTRQGFKVESVRPSKKKLNAEEFRVKTGYSGRTNQHARDAALLVWRV